MTADEPVAGVPRLCARRADCTRPRGHDDDCGPDRADTELADLRAEVERLVLDLRIAHDEWEASGDEKSRMAHAFNVIEYRDEAREQRGRAEKAEAERDALQRQVDAVRDAIDEALMEQAGLPGPVVFVAALRAALDAVEPADQRVWLCSQCGEMPSAMVKIGTSDGWCVTCLDLAVEPADQPHPTPEADEACDVVPGKAHSLWCVTHGREPLDVGGCADEASS
jgi:hypothetical protein